MARCGSCGASLSGAKRSWRGLRPHMDKLGQQAFSKVSDAVLQVRPELLEDLVRLGAG